MARSGTCVNPNIKKSLIEIVEEKCSAETGVCGDLIQAIRSFPVCSFAKKQRKIPVRHDPIDRGSRMEEDEEEHYPAHRDAFDRGSREDEDEPRHRVKRPRKLSQYQKHMSVCLLKEEPFSSCIKMWPNDSMADEYKGNGYTK